jgi:glycosyl hydrolase family 59 (putative galactocerebrosidase)
MQAPRQTAIPSKLCAALDYSRCLRMDGKTLHQIILLILAAAVIGTAAVMDSGSEGLSQSVVTAIAIAKMEVGKPPAGFKFARTGQGGPSRWAVVDDSTSITGRVIEQSSTDRTDYRFPLAIFEPIVAKNVQISVSFKPVAGRVDQAGGIAVRVIDAENYYVVRANALEDNVRFYRVVKGRREQIYGVNTKVAGNAWHTLGLKAQGNHFTIEFGGKTLFTTSDETLAGAGRVGLWTKSDSVTRFDQIAIAVLP